MPGRAYSMTRNCIKVFIDIILVLFVFVSIFLVKKLWTPYERGMFCKDPTIRYPYRESETISDSILLFYGVAVTAFTICVLEFCHIRRTFEKPVILFRKKIFLWASSVYSIVGIFLFGCAVTQLSTVFIKNTLGVLRPYFIAVCQPDWNKTDCGDGHNIFVEDIPCTTSDLDKLEDARTSFPSGHASFSSYTMLFLVIYLQKRLCFRKFCLIRPVIQLAFLLLMVFTCLSRISDYQHHWADVFGGFVLGSCIAILLVFCVSDLYSKESPSDTKKKIATLREEEELNANPFVTA